MLDKLPLELVQQIIRLALPSSYHPLAYRERQDTLLTGSTQLVLLGVVKLTSSRAIESFFEEVKDDAKGRRVKVVRIDRGRARSGSYNTLEKVLRELASRCGSIGEFRIQRENVDMFWLEAFPNLHRLVFVNGGLWTSKPFSLAKLNELSAVDVRLAIDYRVLGPNCYPSLRHLHLELDNYEDLAPGLLLPILPTLDTFSCDYAVIDTTGTAVAPVPHVLLSGNFADSCDIALTVMQHAQHLRITKYVFNGRHHSDCLSTTIGDGIKALVCFGAILPRLSPRPLRTLFLPIEYDPSSPSDKLDNSQCTNMLTFLATCTTLGVEVVFEESPHPFLDSGVSAEFTRRCRVAKAQKEEEERLSRGK